jgi:phosphate transport system protein
MDPMDTSSSPVGSDSLPSRTALDRDERLVKDGVLRMGSLVESQIRDAVRSIVERDPALAEVVIRGDARVNEAQRQIDETVVMTIATQQPVARDLRFLMALGRVASELERIGDHASGVAKQTAALTAQRPFREMADFARMGSRAADLVAGIVSALIDVDEGLAREVAGSDDEIDHLYHKLFEDVVEHMRADSGLIDRGTRLILAAHWVERIGDRVTNVAEDVVYLASGRVEDLNP